MRKLIAMCVIVVVAGVSASGAIDVTTMNDPSGPTATDLAQSILGSGVTISNVSYTGAPVASGVFSNPGGSVIGGITDGVILTSGDAHYAENTSNTSDGITGSNGFAGDADLNALIPGYTSYDASILEFDFQLDAGAGDVFIAYVFASDEYNEYVGSSFNDVFGFLVDGVNIALVPGGTTPVSVNNVNNGANSAYYNDNDPSDLGTPTPYAFEYDGFTDVFKGSASVDAGVHHMKIGIADAGDYILDSAVFIVGGSFGDTDPIVPVPGALLLGMLGLSVAGVKLRKRA